MKKSLIKKIFLTTILLTIFLVMISTANAADNNTNFNELVTNASNNGIIELEEATYVNNTNNIIINKNLTIIGKGHDKTIIDAKHTGRIFDIQNNGSLILINLTFTNGGGVGGLNGGTILNQGKLLIQNCEFTNSNASWGGVISLNGNTFNLSIYNSTFTNNTGTSGGGVMYITNSIGGYFMVANCTFANTVGSAIQKTSGVDVYMTIIDSVFINNYGGASAGAIYLSDSDYEVFITNCTFINNTATGGGAIRNNGNCTMTNCRFISNSVINSGIIYNGRNLTIINSTFTNNTASTFTGVIYNSNYCNLTITNSTFINNSARSDAGVLSNQDYGNLNIINSTFINNSATGRGIIYNAASANLNVINSTFIGNNATYGGAIYNVLNNGRLGNLTVINSIFTNNTAMNSGGAIYNDGYMLVSGNIMSGNSAFSGQMIYNSGTMGILNLTYINNSTIIVKNGQTVTLNANLTDDMGNTVTGQNIRFYVNGTYVGSVTAIEGYATLNYTVTSPYGSVLPVNGSYDGTGNYSIVIKNGELRIQYTTNSTIIAPNTKVGQSTIINGVATDENGKSIADVVINVNINGSIHNIQTNGLGEWNLVYTPNTTGIFNVIVSWNGNNTHNGFTNQTTFNVDKLTSNSTVVAPDTKVGQSTIISGVATDENGKSIADVVINVNINGSIHNIQTNGLGEWNLVYTPNTTGIYSVVVSWNGNTTHNGFINTTSFTVTQTNSTNPIVPGKTSSSLSLFLDRTYGYGYLVGEIATVTWATSGIANLNQRAMIQFIENGKVWHTQYVLLSDGKYQHKFITSHKTLDIVMTFLGDTNSYGSSDKVPTYVDPVNKGRTFVEIQSMSNLTVAKKGNINIIVKDYKGNIIQTGKVILKFDNKWSFTVNIKDGVAKFSKVFTKAGNNRTLEITYIKQGNNTSSSISTRIVVNKK